MLFVADFVTNFTARRSSFTASFIVQSSSVYHISMCHNFVKVNLLTGCPQKNNASADCAAPDGVTAVAEW